MQSGGEERSVSGSGRDLPVVQLSFKDRDLVAGAEVLGVLGTVAHRQEPEHRKSVGYAEADQSKQHEAASSSSDGRRPTHTRNVGRCKILPLWSKRRELGG